MKHCILAFFVSLLLVPALMAQEKNPDTAGTSLHLYIPGYYSSGEMGVYNPMLDFKSNGFDTINPRLLVSFMLSGQTKENFWQGGTKFNFLDNYLGYYIESTKFNPFRAALGAAELGAVGYLAYKHFKKYGFK